MPLFNSNIDLDQNQLIKAVIHSGSTKPNDGSEVAGQIFYDTDTNQLQVYNGTIWQGLATEEVDTDDIFNAGLRIGRDSHNMLDFETADNTIDIYLNNAKDFTFTANTFTAQSGSTIAAQALTATTGVFSGILKTDDTTAATSTTDGSLQTDGGLSVALDAVVGDDLILLSDASVIHFGTNSEITLTHVHNEGLKLSHTATGDNTTAKFTIESGEADLRANEEIASIDFKASDSDGSDGALVGARIVSVAGATFSASNNKTNLEFQIGQSEAADTDTVKFHMTGDGEFLATGDIQCGDDLLLNSDSSVLSLGAGLDAKLTHDGTTGLVISANPITLDSAADIVLDAGGNDILFKAGGTHVMNITNSSSDVIFKPIVDGKDIIFQQRDGTEVARIEDNATFNVSSAGKFAYAGTAVTSTAAELNVLDGITAVVGELNALDIGSTAIGTAVASKAVILDSNKDYTGVRNLTITGNLSVAGTTTQVDTVTMNAENAVVFEGATADAHETTLTIVDPTADHTYKLPDLGSTADEGFIAAFAADPGTSPLITSTPTELNLLDGVTSTTAELNILDGVTSTAAELNILDGVTSTAAELNILDGVTSTAAELNILDGVTATAAELNLLDGGTARGTTALADGDGILINDAGTMRMTTVQTVATYMIGTLTEVGALDAGSITANFGAIDNGTSGIRTATFTAETAFVPAASDGATLGTSSLEFADLFLADGAQILFGDDQEIAITHNADKGLTLSHETAGTDNKPFILTLESEEDAIVNGDIIAGIEFKAGDSDGTDAILPAVGIFAVATETFASSKNQAKLVFNVAQTETAGSASGALDAVTADMTLDHAGNLTIPGELDAATGDFSGAVDIAGDLTLSAGADGALTFGAASSIKIVDNQAASLVIEQADVAYMTFKTSNSSELVTVNKPFNVASTFSLGGTAVTSTAAELNALDGITAVVGELNALDIGSTAVGTAVASKAVILDSNKDYTGIRNFTVSGELDAATGDFSGAVDIAGDLTLSAGADGALTFGAASSIKIVDNQAASLVIEEANTAYMTFKTTNSSELITANKAFNAAGAFQIGGTAVTSTAAELNILDGVTSTAAELNILDGVSSTAAELNILDGVTSTTAEINLIDGGTSRGTTAVADGDGILTNDGGTMRMTKVETFATYFAAECAGLREKAFILNNSTSGVASSDNITYTVTHSLSSRNVMVEVIRNGENSGDFATVYTDIKRTSDDIITVVFGSARTAGDYTVMIRKIG